MLERKIAARLSPLKSLTHIGDVRTIGGVGIIELVQEKASKSAGGYLDRIGPQLSAEFLRRGLLLRPLGNIIYFHASICYNR